MGVQEAVFVGFWQLLDVFTHFPTKFVQGCSLTLKTHSDLLINTLKRHIG